MRARATGRLVPSTGWVRDVVMGPLQVAGLTAEAQWQEARQGAALAARVLPGVGRRLTPTDVFIVVFGGGVTLFAVVCGLIAGFNWLSDWIRGDR